MSRLRIVTLGGKEFPLGDFTLDQVSRISVLLPAIGEVQTQPQAAARNTVVHIGLQSGGYADTYETFLQVKGVKLGELIGAVLEVGRAIGYYEEKDAEPGEAVGEASPSAN